MVSIALFSHCWSFVFNCVTCGEAIQRKACVVYGYDFAQAANSFYADSLLLLVWTSGLGGMICSTYVVGLIFNAIVAPILFKNNTLVHVCMLLF